ncbi:hypothetical protein [Goodfellowiella coeruleoviolacea]|uniref:Uncharacterized protein n=1 Tax=Goodfellowiella coeruleoviolacea TaxID=334858 RepID=A0AAE3GK52_9PSEU|nr:hypothetical protein [Goodfellowiella coeruleoviolacea]MCP2169675.1 hypothetical protein [Goodfellowiella coeruleoviolacea]
MTADPAWARLVRAEHDYLVARQEILDADPVATLRAVFASGRDQRTALRLLDGLAAGRPDLVVALLPEVFEAALSLEKDGMLARQLLARLTGPERDQALEPLVAGQIGDPDPERWAELRALATLLEELGRLDLLERLKDAVRDSPSEDLRDIAEDFPEMTDD